ncbi:MAG: type II secretion system F family protein [Halobacteriota archaeon]|nr:type II secretion system F family protein [Halobacteriota archaeon]
MPKTGGSSIYRGFDTPMPEHIKKFGVPVISFGVIFSVLMRFLLPGLFAIGFAKYIIYSIPLFCVFFVFIYPMMQIDAKRIQIEQNIHYFITHLGVLATSDMPLKGIFELIGEKKVAYKALADEVEKIFKLVEYWHLSTPDAIRFIARRSPSIIFTDFLDRFAHALESGEKPDTFLMTEQDVVMREYDIMYKGALTRVTMIQEMYMSLVMSLLFMGSFAIIMPLITGTDPSGMMGMTALMFLFMEIVMLFYIKSRAPKDRVWHTLDKTEKEKKVINLFPIMIVLGIILAIFSYILFPESKPQIIIAISITPLLVPGYIASKEEKKIKRRDDSYASFIRSLGASASSRGGIVDFALKELRLHDFGALTDNIQNLYHRTIMRIDKMKSWYHFSKETESNLIQRCNDMFIEAVDVGGNAEETGRIISDNFIHIISLRKLRYDAGSGMTGTLYGLIGGVSATFYISLAVVQIMQEILASSQIPEGAVGGLLEAEISISLMNLFLVVIMFGHSLLSSMLIRFVDGGHMYTVPLHFVGMFWVGTVVSVMTVNGVNNMVGGFIVPAG